MSNYKVLDQEYIQKLLQPFAPGMSNHITPIKYEALTPDCFLLLFCTTGHNNEQHYFVSLETDFVSSLDGAECTIVDWHGPIIQFLPLHTKGEVEPSDDIENYKTETDNPYFGLLAEVQRPTSKGYWAEAVKIMPGDTISDKIKHYNKKEQVSIRKTLASILQHKVDAQASFLDSYQAKRKDTIVDDTNNTDIAVSLYVQPNGEVEYFYNYVHSTVGGKERKSSRKN